MNDTSYQTEASQSHGLLLGSRTVDPNQTITANEERAGRNRATATGCEPDSVDFATDRDLPAIASKRHRTKRKGRPAAVVRFESPTISADDQDRFRGLALSVAKNLRISSSILRSWTPASSPLNAVSAI